MDVDADRLFVVAVVVVVEESRPRVIEVTV
jgi:hypothetical protein